ncbi:tetratricopeptide repeat protein [Vicingus serpentipes]|uniref:Tetratricopeptide repeat protein n=1 Tax=Vicingus serpentipes TaxID=1926625 RepID=A0A5C6RS02_9FLAO|nr:tetratricopeptide repeat protein [Vicingus serpentipes]TXB64799.1 tetratricopeptide repeat protein [Vicingus serpentipes]
MRKLVYILFYLLPLFNVAQNLSKEDLIIIDSIKVELNSTNNDSVKVLLYGDWDNIVYYNNPIQGIELNQKIKSICEQNLNNSNLSKGQKIFFQESLANSHNNLGLYYSDQGKIEEAVEQHFTGLKISELINDSLGKANAYNNIGNLYADLENYDEALSFYDKSFKIKKMLDDKKGMSSYYTNVGNIFSSLGQDDKALDYYKTGLSIDIEIEDRMGESVTLHNIGGIYASQNKTQFAKEKFLLSLKIAEDLDIIERQSLTLNSLALLELKLKNYSAAYNYAAQSYKLAKEIGLIYELMDAADILYEVYFFNKEYKKAIEKLEEYILLNDSLTKTENQSSIIKENFRHEYEKQKAIDDKEHEKQIVIEQEAKKQQQVITYATAAGLGLVAIFLIFVFNRLQVTKKQKLIIEKQKKSVELANHQLEEKNQEILDSINYAKRIQNAILPPNKVVKEFLPNSFILYKPKDIVAGDFYWMESLVPTGNKKDTAILFAAADCTGHGVPGAMVSVVCNNGLNRSVREYGLTDPGEILNKTREIVIAEFEKSEEEVKDGMDIALCSLKGNTLHYAGANNPLWIVREGELLETKANKQPIGQFDNPEPYKTHTIELQKGDSIYIFSDGYVDQFGGEKGKKFKAKAFRELLLSIQETPMEEQRTIIDNAFENWRGNLEQIDDVCVIGVRI